MPRVFTAKAAKDYPEHGIAKGETYFYWTFYRSAKRMSKTRPRASQLTQREDFAAMFRAQELAEDVKWLESERESIGDALDDIISQLEEARDAGQDKHDNMPENFQNAEQGQNLEGFISECEDTIGELESLRDEIRDEDTPFDECGSLEDISWPNEY